MIGNYQAAIKPLNTHLLLFPEDITAAYLLGQSHEATGDTDAALIFYERTLDIGFTATGCAFQDGLHLSRARSTSTGH